MRAAIYPGAGQPLTIEDVTDPEPGPDDLIIKIHRCGICGTDLHMTEGHAFQFPAGSTPGHEFAGEVVAKGRDVTGWKSGDRLTALPSLGCGQCAACAHGNWTLCRNKQGGMGGFADYVRVAAPAAVRLPDSLSMADGALVEPLAVGLYGVRQAANISGARVLVLGAGTVALTAIWWARRLGAGRIAATSRSPRRGNMTLAMGADAFIAADEDEAAQINSALDGEADIVLECVGNPGFLAKAISHVRTLGEVISMGFCTAPDSLIPAMAAFKGATLKFPVGYALSDFERAVTELERGHADPKMLVTSTTSLADLADAFAALRQPHAETKVHMVN
jgi:2-desacetyl-2-hydroxyethyl bacteriochlorophyllide A dehydrogenase